MLQLFLTVVSSAIASVQTFNLFKPFNRIEYETGVLKTVMW